MGERGRATSLLALTLLGCFVVDAQKFLGSAQMPRTIQPQPELGPEDQLFPLGYYPPEPPPQGAYNAPPFFPKPPPYTSAGMVPPLPQKPVRPQDPYLPLNLSPGKVPTSLHWPPNLPPPNVPLPPDWPPNPPQPNVPVSPHLLPNPHQPNVPVSPHLVPNPHRPNVPIFPHLPPNPHQPNDPISPPWPPKPHPPIIPPQQPPNVQPHPQRPPSPQKPPQKPRVATAHPPTVPPYLPPKPQKPTLSQKPVTLPHIPTQQPIQSCDVAQGQRVRCGLPGITAAACNAISCCFDGYQCYYGTAVTVQCTKDAQFIVVIAKDATLPKIDLQSISLLGDGQGCKNVDSNSKFAIYQFPVTACGTTVSEQPGVIIYENRMSSSYEVGVGPLGAITRDSYYQFIFQCRYIGTSVKSAVAQVSPLEDPPLPVAALGPITVELRLANGQCQTKGCNQLDVAYNSFYSNYPVTKVLRDPVFVEVHLTGKTDPNLVLTLGHCWTTTTPTPHSLPQWDILVDGCPFKDDRYLSSLVSVGPSSNLNFPTHYRRFVFQMFTFVDPTSLAHLKENVYIHCSTAVCTSAPGSSCEPLCARKKRDAKAAVQKNAEPKVVASIGPVIMGVPEQQTVQKVKLSNSVENVR